MQVAALAAVGEANLPDEIHRLVIDLLAADAAHFRLCTGTEPVPSNRAAG